MNVTILLDAAALVPTDDAEDVAVTSVSDAAMAVRDVLARAGHTVRLAPLADEPTALLAAGLTVAREADVLFNLAESLGRTSEGEIAAAWLAAMTGLPVTGAPPRSLSICLDKPLARAALAAEGLPVPEARVMRSGDESLEGLPLPAIVKPAAEDASHGIDDESVVHDQSAARARARSAIQRFGVVLVEELIEGREIQVAMLGQRHEAPELLPFGEIDFSAVPEGAPRILTYAAKWDESSERYQSTPAVAARPLPPELDAQVRDIASRAWRALGLAGYARIDLRVHAERGPFVIDVNPNPDLSPGAGLSLAASRAGMTHEQLILRILDLAAAPLAGR